MRYLYITNTKPWINLAIEEYLFRNGGEETVFLLWQNEPTIVVGKNQNTYDEINNEFVTSKGIHVIRRITGGGAVYHDLGNVNFSIISQSSDSGIDFKIINKPVIDALQGWGIPCEMTGRNDLVINGSKFSGIAQYKSKGRVLNHGTLLFDTNLDILGQALNVKEDKLQGKGVQSVKKRVTNIKPWLKENMEVKDFISELGKSISKISGEKINPISLTQEELIEIDRLANEKYRSSDWVYGDSPKFTNRFRKKFASGIIELYLYKPADKVEEAHIFGDFFGTEDVTVIENAMKGKVWNIDEVEKALDSIGDLNLYFGNIKKDELISWWFHE